MSADAADLFDGDSGTWLFAPSIRLPIFTGGRLSAQLDLAEVRKEIAVTRYEKAIQTAFRETADALAGIGTFGEQLQAAELGLQANQTYYALARERYDQGVDSYLVLLDAQRSLYRARQSVVVIRLAMLVNKVNLYKVLGGGWQAKS
jgi:multidrug efflux system outer membrane protein